MRLALPWVVVAAVGEAGYRGVVVAAVDEAGCRGSGWRTVWVWLPWVRLTFLGCECQRARWKSAQALCRIPLPKVSYYATATKPDFRQGICCGRGRSFTAAGLPRARPLVRDSSCQLCCVRTFPKPGFDHLKTRKPLRVSLYTWYRMCRQSPPR